MHYRRVATRYEKHTVNLPAMGILASMRIWMRVTESVTQLTDFQQGLSIFSTEERVTELKFTAVDKIGKLPK